MGGETHVSTGVDILILGAGWTSQFLIPLLESHSITYAATSTTGREKTLKFRFEYDASTGDRDSLDQYARLPIAKTILIVFPLKGEGQSKHLRDSYLQTHPELALDCTPGFIQLGSTGIWDVPGQSTWVTRKSPYNKEGVRAIAEDELLTLGNTTVLDLSGLWGGQRHVKHWLNRVAPTKEKLATKKTLHMIHGLDVARAIVAVHGRFDKAAGQRWMLTDMIVYDWWELILIFAGEKLDAVAEDFTPQGQVAWVGELMREHQIPALPRSADQLGRCYDVVEFWTTFGLMPVRAGVTTSP